MTEKKEKGPSPYGPVKFKTIDEYHDSYQGRVREQLDEIRRIISSTVPEATELISYNMPAFRKFRNLVCYSAHKNHIGLYPGPAPIKAFEDELKGYTTSKGAIQFPLDRNMPADIIKKIVSYNAGQDELKAAEKKKG